MSWDNEGPDSARAPEFPLTGDPDDVANPITERRAAYLQPLISSDDKQ